MIEGGYILLARKMFESDIMDKPPHYLKLWVWMLGKAFWKNGDKLQRGQFSTTIKEMQKAGGYKVGYRTRELTKGEVRSAYEDFAKNTMISTMKSTRGMVITICNYEAYQNPKNYEEHSEHSTKTLRRTRAQHTIDEEGLKERKEKNLIAIPHVSILKSLNDATGSRFKLTDKLRALIQARWNEGFRVEDFEHVFQVKVDEWGNDPKMCKYLRPDTLLGTKFNSYRQQKKRMDTSDFLRSLENDE